MGIRDCIKTYERILRLIVLCLMVVSGFAIMSMMFLTCADVSLRYFWKGIPGTLDMVQILGAIALAGALPYTTAVKGHVAIEYFFHKLPGIGRIAVDTIVRSLGILLFLLLAWRNAIYGLDLLDSNRVTSTIQIPIFWLPWFIGLCCLVMSLVILYNLTHPGKVMIKP
ncbi:MAG: TRAP transporter small permease [Candidatus Sumerlaeia bacterium]